MSYKGQNDASQPRLAHKNRKLSCSLTELNGKFMAHFLSPLNKLRHLM